MVERMSKQNVSSSTHEMEAQYEATARPPGAATPLMVHRVFPALDGMSREREGAAGRTCLYVCYMAG